jgi:hypothetical protein
MKRIIPSLIVFHHGVEDAQQLAHAGHQRHFFEFSCRKQTLVKRFDNRVVASRYQGGHVQRTTHRGTSPTDAAPALELARIMVVRRHPDQRTDLAAIEFSQLGQLPN